MHSMTGYGHAQISRNGIKVLVEVQSVNKRQTEILTNIPSALASLEGDIRAKIDRSLSRGRIIVTISVTGPASHAPPALARRHAKPYPDRAKLLRKEVKLPEEIAIENIP